MMTVEESALATEIKPNALQKQKSPCLTWVMPLPVETGTFSEFRCKETKQAGT